MRIFGLIFGALLASTSIAAAQNCPGTFASCPPVAAGRINLGGPIVNQQGVPLVPPTALPQAGQVLTANGDTAGTTRWSNAGGGIAAPGSTNTGNVPLWNSTTGAALANGLPTAVSGSGVLLQTDGSGLIARSTLPIATTTGIGGMIPDGTTIVVNPSTGVASAVGGAATSVVIGTTTVGGGGSGLLANSSGVLGTASVTGSGPVVMATGATLVAPVLGTPASAVLTNATGYLASALAGSALPSGVTASSLTSLGTLTRLTVGGVANTVGVVDTTAATAGTYGLSSTSGLNLGGTICAPGQNGCVINQQISYTENVTSAVRMRYMVDNITGVSSGNSGIDEGLFLERHLSSNNFTAEVNGYHGYVQIDAGVTHTGQVESFECSNLNNGTVGTISCYLSLSHNGSTGTTSNMIGVKAQLTNDNGTPGSVGEYDAFVVTPVSGTAPTHNFAFKNTDATATMMTLGNLVVSQTRDAASNEMLHIFSTVNSGFTTNNTFPLIITGTIGNILAVYDSGKATLAGSLSLGISSGGSPQIGQLQVTNGVSGSAQITLTPPGGGAVLTSAVLTLPDVTGTLAEVNVAQSWSGKQTMAASATGGASFNIPQGSTPTSPANGDIWATASGLFVQIAGSTVGPLGSGGGGGAVSSVTNVDGTLTISPATGAVVASINPAAAITWTGTQIIQGPDTGSTIPFKVTNSANALNLVVPDNGQVTMANSLAIGSNGSPGVAGALMIFGSGSGSVKLISQNASSISSIITIVSTQASDQVMMLGSNATLTAPTINFSAANTTTFAGTINVTGTLKSGGVTGVSCAANSVVLTTFAIAGGVVTHC